MWIVCCGSKRSGSTLQYNIVSKLVEKTNSGITIGHLDSNSFSKVKRDVKKHKGFMVFKSHYLLEGLLDEFKSGNAKGIYCFRDVRDVLVSISIKSDIPSIDLINNGTVRKYLENYNVWNTIYPIYRSKYENFAFNIYQEAKNISDFLSLDASEHILNSISEELDIKKQKEIINQSENAIVNGNYSFDSKTLLHSNHIYDGKIGKWRNYFSKKELKRIEKMTFNWLYNHGYNLKNKKFYSKVKLYSYSQHGEDDLIWKFFSKKKNGLIIEVGAFDGIHLSNSYALEKVGWKSILIEPHPFYYPILVSNRPNAICINAACLGSADIKKINLKVENLGLLSGLEINEEDIKRRYKKRDLKFEGVKDVLVPGITLNEALEQNGIESKEIDCLSIDVEGAELEVLKGLDIEKYKPKLIIVEANNSIHEAKVVDFFENYPKYYKGRKIGVNIVFARGKRNAKKLSAIKLDCIPMKQSHPLGKNYTIEGVVDNSGYKITFFSKIKRKVSSIIKNAIPTHTYN